MKYLFVFVLFISASGLRAQSNFEAYITPGFGNRYLALKSGQDNSVKDSFNMLDRARQNWSFGLNYIHGFNRNLMLQFGIEYHRMSFTRVREDLQFHDTIHPSIGRIEDLSQTVQKDAFFYHKYRYIGIPIVLQTFIAPKYGRKNASIYFISGVSMDLLVEDKIDVFLKGYTAKGKSEHTVVNDYSASSFNVNMIIGGRFEFNLEEKLTFSIQPHITYPMLITAQDAFTTMRIYQTNLRVGISKTL